jgi:hypothetical protein
VERDTAESHAVQLPLHRTEAGFDISQTVAISQLRESHGQILIPAREGLLLIIAAITSHTFLKLVGGQVVQELGENGSARVHSPFLHLNYFPQFSSEKAVFDFSTSNRQKPKPRLTPCFASD